MANSSNIRPFIQKWEGGLSRDSNDSASSNPAPWMHNGLTGWHTNKGVTFNTFKSLSNKLGYAVTADNFFTMPPKIWDAIFKVGYWDTWGLDNLKSQAIADLIACFSWGSGAGGSFTSVKKYLATKNITVASRSEAVEALNQLSSFNEQPIFLELVNHREAFFKSLSSFASFGRGWLNRLDALKDFGIETIAKKKIKIVAICLISLVLIAAVGVFFYKKK